MKLNLPKLMSMLIFAAAMLLNFSCAKDSDLLVDYVVGDNNTSIEEDKDEEPQDVVIDLENAVITTKEDKPVTFNILNNTTSKGSGRRTYKSSRKPRYGSFTIQKDSIALYTPLNDFNGTDDLELTLEVTNEDESTSEVVVTVDITIDPVTDVVQDTIVATTDDPIVIEPLKNDTFKKESTVTITEISEPANGTAVLNNDNTITYTPKANTSGEETFTYTTSITNIDETVSTEQGTILVSKEAITETPPASEDIDYGPLKAFPTAYGAGAYASGGRGGKVIHVTNLNRDGAGSFVEALNTTGKRIIVFDVSGTIDLGGNKIYIQGDNKSNVTVAGQTAPKGGITVKNGNINFRGVNNTIIRYIRFRNAQMSGGSAVEQDSFTYWGGNNIIMDHCSASFAGDETISFVATDANDISNVTLQRTLIGGSKTGGIMGSSSRATKVGDMSYLFNLNADNGHRTPNLAGNARFDVINNVVFNWDGRGSTLQFDTKVNQIGNYYKPGAHTEKWSVNDTKHKRQSGNNSIYTRENYFGGLLTGSPSENNQVIWATFRGSDPLSSSYFTSTQFGLLGEPFPILSPQEAYEDVLSNVGANKYMDDNGVPQTYLDSYDQIKINNTINKISTGKLSGWVMPSLPTNKRASSYDTDGDGMADAWELANGLDPNNPDDAAADRNNDGYTNLEDFLNQVDFL